MIPMTALEPPRGMLKHEAPGDDLNHGQSQKTLHDSEEGSGAAKGPSMRPREMI